MYDLLLALITREHAVEYSEETDKVLWVHHNLLDPNDLPRSDDLVDFCERRLDELLVLRPNHTLTY